MRFDEVHLENIPGKGLISISGANESGKSTLRHLITFIISGKHPHNDNLVELINWEKGHMQAEGIFGVSGNEWKISRQVERDQSCYSSLEINGQTVAQGNKQINETFKKEIGYPADQLLRSFIVDHEVLFKWIKGETAEHISHMCGLKPMQHMSYEAQNRCQTSETDLKESGAKLDEMEKNRANLNYDAQKEVDLSDEIREYEASMGNLKESINHETKNYESTQRHAESIDKELKVIPAKADDAALDEFEKESSNILQRLKEINLEGEFEGTLKTITQKQESIIKFFKDRIVFSNTIQETLSSIRKNIGLADIKPENVDPESIHGKELNVKRQMSITKKQFRFWLFSCLSMLLIAIGMVFIFIFRKEVMSFIGLTPIYDFLHTGKGTQFYNWIYSHYEFTNPDFTFKPTALIFPGVVVLLTVFHIWLMSLKRNKFANSVSEFNKIQKLKTQEENIYQKLLAIDIKDLQPACSILENSEHETLTSSLDNFKKNHSDFCEVEFNVSKVVLDLKNSLEELSSNLSIELHRIQSEIQNNEEKMASCQNSLAEIEPLLKDMLERKTKFQELSVEIESHKKGLIKMKKDFARDQYLIELSNGTYQSVMDRILLTFTALFKNVMPEITQERYRSVKLDKNFKIHVFSEDRSDFVQLEQLSSGTNDLFMLILQIFLAHSYAESCGVKDHFIFFDEPLLAVDPVRYGKFLEIAPELSPILNQVFICRPPENFSTAHALETNLADRELKKNF